MRARAWRASLIPGAFNGAGLGRSRGGAAASSDAVWAKRCHQSRKRIRQTALWLDDAIIYSNLHLIRGPFYAAECLLTSFSMQWGYFNAWEGSRTPDGALKWLTDITVQTIGEAGRSVAAVPGLENEGREREDVCRERAKTRVLKQEEKKTSACQAVEKWWLFMDGLAPCCACCLLRGLTFFARLNTTFLTTLILAALRLMEARASVFSQQAGPLSCQAKQLQWPACKQRHRHEFKFQSPPAPGLIYSGF